MRPNLSPGLTEHPCDGAFLDGCRGTGKMLFRQTKMPANEKKGELSPSLVIAVDTDFSAYSHSIVPGGFEVTS